MFVFFLSHPKGVMNTRPATLTRLCTPWFDFISNDGRMCVPVDQRSGMFKSIENNMQTMQMIYNDKLNPSY